MRRWKKKDRPTDQKSHLGVCTVTGATTEEKVRKGINEEKEAHNCKQIGENRETKLTKNQKRKMKVDINLMPPSWAWEGSQNPEETEEDSEKVDKEVESFNMTAKRETSKKRQSDEK